MKLNYPHASCVGIALIFASGLSHAGAVAEQIQTSSSVQTSGIVGHLGIGNGINYAHEVDQDESGNDTGDVWFGTVDGSITAPFADSWLASLAGYYRYDDFSSEEDFDDDENPEQEYMLGLNLMKQFTPDTRAGLLFGYGDTRRQDRVRADSYDVFMYGAEVHHFFKDDVMLYAQLGMAEKGRDGADEAQGFKTGFFSRFGATYFMNERSTINLDLEAAGNYDYIDNNDPGRFFGMTAYYQHKLFESTPLYLNCFGRLDNISSTDEGNVTEEWQLGFGFKYIFGAGSSLDAARKGANIGLPRLPTRASAWTEFNDN